MGQGFDFEVGQTEIDSAARTAVLTPFEKLRLRANSTPDMTSYEANIWPVGLSATIAEKLTVCGEGGLKWPIPGVPMTCPLAMSKDAWAYWDSGMIDYLNPNAVRGIAAATNPVACISENLASVAFDSQEAKEQTATPEEGPENKKVRCSCGPSEGAQGHEHVLPANSWASRCDRRSNTETRRFIQRPVVHPLGASRSTHVDACPEHRLRICGCCAQFKLLPTTCSEFRVAKEALGSGLSMGRDAVRGISGKLWRTLRCPGERASRRSHRSTHAVRQRQVAYAYASRGSADARCFQYQTARNG